MHDPILGDRQQEIKQGSFGGIPTILNGELPAEFDDGVYTYIDGRCVAKSQVSKANAYASIDRSLLLTELIRLVEKSEKDWGIACKAEREADDLARRSKSIRERASATMQIWTNALLEIPEGKEWYDLKTKEKHRL